MKPLALNAALRSVGLAVALSFVVVACNPSADESSVTAGQPTTSSTVVTSTTVVGTTSMLDPVAEALRETVELAVVSPSDVVAPGILDGVDVAAGLPDGAVVTPFEDMLVVSGDVAEMVVEVSLPDGTVDRFVVVLVNDGSRWLIAYTVKLT